MPLERVLPALSVALVACDPFHAGFEDLEPARYYTARHVVAPRPLERPLRVMTWNIKFGGGAIDFFFDCYGDRVLMSRDEVLSHLGGLAAKIRKVDPDVLLLQEVDVNSKRSAFVDELEWLLDHTALNFGVYASAWRADFVPSDGLGAVDSGNAVLSRFPLENAERIALPRRGDQDVLTRYFYLRRNLLRTDVVVPGGPALAVVAVHAEAYATDDTKRLHIERFEAELDAESAGVGWVIGGGDLNALPPGSEQVRGFDDQGCTEDFVADDYSAERTWLDGLYAKFHPAITLEAYQKNNAVYFTHTTRPDGFWNRKLDYLFASGEWISGSGLVHQDEAHGGTDTRPLSDHAPLSAEIELRDLRLGTPVPEDAREP